MVQYATLQNVLLNEAARWTATNSSTASDHVWDPVRARFSDRALRVVAAVPAVVTACVLASYALRPVWKRRPQWAKQFNKEPYIPCSESTSTTKRRIGLPCIALLLVALVGTSMQVVSLTWPEFNPMAIFSLVAWVIASASTLMTRPKSAPTSLLLIYIGILISNGIILAHRSARWREEDAPPLASLLMALFGTVIVFMMPLRDPTAVKEGIGQPSEAPTSALRSPEDDLTLWQFLTASWMAPLISVGASRQLNDADVWSLSYEFQHKSLYRNFRALPGSVLHKLILANASDLIFITFLGIVQLCANLSVPVILQQILRSMEDPRAPSSATITYAFLSLVVRLIAAQSGVTSLWYSRRAYEKSRGEMITILHEKTLTRKIVGSLDFDTDKKMPAETEENGNALSVMTNHKRKRRTCLQRTLKLGNAVTTALSRPFRMPKQLHGQQNHLLKQVKQPASKGKILNILRNDAYEVSQRFWEFPDLVTKPLGLILSVVLIWKLIGWPCLIGVVALLIGQFVNAFAARILLKWERHRRVTSDTKLQKISEVVEAIRHLRWYAWQDSWLSRIMQARQRELGYRIITGLLRVLITFVNNLSSGIFPVIAFYAYCSLAGLPLRIDIIFPSLQLFGMLRDTLREIPNLITVLLNASVAMGRINDFMNEPDVPKIESVDRADELALEHASFAWPGTNTQILTDLTVSFPPGITLVCGRVAAGKTALLQALLGELDKVEGRLIRPEEIFGYCSQMPWLQSMSIRENILFSSPYDAKRYKEVLEACALIPDLANFKNGDLSSIGENGIGLSGGQKARVALARAVYSKARILLLDDPISSLDYTTSEYIVQKCFAGPLMDGRIVVLVTHRTEQCRAISSQVLELTDGRARLLDAEESLTSNGILQITATDSQLSNTKDQDSDAIPEDFMTEEHRQHGQVRLSVFWKYIKAGKIRWWFVLICILSVNRLLGISSTWFLKTWGKAYDESHEMTAAGTFLDNYPSPYRNLRPWLLTYLAIALLRATVFLVAQLAMLLITYTAGKHMFSDAMRHVCYATFRFYDVTPVGRLMNRLTSDMSIIDGNISQEFQAIAMNFIAWSFALAVIAAVTPLFLIFSVGFSIAFVLIFRPFYPTAQSLRRLEMVSLSPLMSNFGTLLDGLITVRAFRAQERFQDRLIEVVDAFQKMDHFYWTLHVWLMFRLDTLSAFSTLVATALAVYGGVDPSLTAFILVAVNKFVNATHGLCKQYGKVTLDFVSVERVVELLDIEQEPAGEPVPAYWPSIAPDVTFDDVTIRYAPDDDAALSHATFTLKGGTNTAVVGRTGSGKSTLALAVLATVRAESGRVLIDGVDVAGVDTHALRSRATFVAQDPVLFPGTLRDNLDPLGEHSDEACLAVLRKVAARHGWSLATPVDTHGKNLSQGQRQLVGLARAVLRRSPIVVLDEATASIDAETSMHVQSVLREELGGSTVITIAHRLEAVRGADYCIVLSKGRVERQGPAADILNGRE